MITNWTAPKAGATVYELFCTFCEWPKHIPRDHRLTARTSLAIVKPGLVVIDEYDRQRLNSENLEVES